MLDHFVPVRFFFKLAYFQSTCATMLSLTHTDLKQLILASPLGFNGLSWDVSQHYYNSVSNCITPVFWSSGGRVCHSFIPGMCNHSAAHSVSNTPFWICFMTNCFYRAICLCFIYKWWFMAMLCVQHHDCVSSRSLRMVQQGPTCLCSPGILWHPHMSSDRPVTPVTAE